MCENTLTARLGKAINNDAWMMPIEGHCHTQRSSSQERNFKISVYTITAIGLDCLHTWQGNTQCCVDDAY